MGVKIEENNENGGDKDMKYFVFRKRMGYNHDLFWQYNVQFEDMTKEELEKNYIALEDCIIIEGIRKYIVPSKAKLI